LFILRNQTAAVFVIVVRLILPYLSDLYCYNQLINDPTVLLFSCQQLRICPKGLRMTVATANEAPCSRYFL